MQKIHQVLTLKNKKRFMQKVLVTRKTLHAKFKPDFQLVSHSPSQSQMPLTECPTIDSYLSYAVPLFSPSTVGVKLGGQRKLSSGPYFHQSQAETSGSCVSREKQEAAGLSLDERFTKQTKAWVCPRGCAESWDAGSCAQVLGMIHRTAGRHYSIHCQIWSQTERKKSKNCA